MRKSQKLNQSEVIEFESLIKNKVFTRKELIQKYRVASSPVVLSQWKAKRVYPAFLCIFLEIKELRDEIAGKDNIIKKLMSQC